ncbi:MAG: tetratricopeptide repeat protein [Anaerolineales bacterium]|nr:tetratricopeptide repeat protein [Anaerolineales bacterium]
MSQLRIVLLGNFEVYLDEQPVDQFRSDKVRALLAYLAVTRASPQRRSYLAALLWPEYSDKRASHNLRQAILNLKTVLHTSDSTAKFLLVERDAIQLNPRAEIRVDANVFTEQLDLALGCFESRCMPRCFHVRRLKAAISLYHGRFLERFFLADSSPFEEWAMLQRESLNHRAVEAYELLVEYHERRAEYSLARQYATALVKLVPWQENAHRLLMHLYAVDGLWSAAQNQYYLCQKYLSQELGVPPAPETEQLYQELQDRAIQRRPADPRYPPASSKLPPRTTSFVGRQAQVDRLIEMLIGPGGSLVSLVGPGGIGKTCLALEVGNELVGLFADGVFLVPLAALTSAESLLPTVADHLGFMFYRPDQRLQQLQGYLAGKNLLLILDNCEHLLTGDPGNDDCPPLDEFVTALLAQGSGITILATSRRPFGLKAEQLFEVQGMDYPASEAIPSQQSYEALTLFEQIARRKQPLFSLAAEFTAVALICRLLEGNPLGIELAANWVVDYTCLVIATEIQRSLDFLATSMKDMPERHRSLGAVFEHSWNLLAPVERQALARLSVFRGGFSLPAAQQVAQADLGILNGLVEKSLLHRVGSERYEIHETIRQYGEERLALHGDSAERTRTQHADFIADWLSAQLALTRSAEQKNTLDRISREIPNLLLAWDWALHRQDYSVLDRSIECLKQFFDIRSRFQEGRALFHRAASEIEAHYSPLEAAPGPIPAIYGRLILYTGWFTMRLGDYSEARTLTQRSVALLQATTDTISLAYACTAFGYFSEDAETRLAYLQRSLALHTQAGHLPGQISALNMLAILLRSWGRYQEARQAFEQAVVLCEQVEDQWSLSVTLNNLGYLERIQGRLEQARAAHQKSLELKQLFDDQRGIAVTLSNLAFVAIELGDYDQARRDHLQSLAISRQVGDVFGMFSSINNLGDLAYEMGDYEQAYAYHQQGLEIQQSRSLEKQFTLKRIADDLMGLGKDQAAWPMYLQAFELAVGCNHLPFATAILLNLARIFVQSQQPVLAVELLAMVAHHPASQEKTRQQAGALLDELEQQVAEKDFQAANTRGQAAQLEQALALIPKTPAHRDSPVS